MSGSQESRPLHEEQPGASNTQPADRSESQNDNNAQVTGEQQNQHCMKPKDIKIRYKILMLFLGVWKCPDELAKDGKCAEKCIKWILRSVQPLVLISITLFSSSILLVYLFCFNGKVNHQLIFLSFVSYWVSLISPEIICTFAWMWNFCVNVLSMDINSEDVHRGHIFHVEKMSKKFEGKISVKLIIFGVFALFTFILRIVLSWELSKEGCLLRYDKAWTGSDILNIVFYTLFCYFLYLQRVALEAEGYTCFKGAKTLIRKQSRNCYLNHCSVCNPEQYSIRSLEQCKNQIIYFFQNYKRLRKLLLPWIWIILFCSSCGITAVFTWNYNSAQNSTVSTPEPAPLKTAVCNITCDKISSLLAKERFLIYVNMLILLRNVMTAGFALSVLNGIDLKHVWDTFRERFFTIYLPDEELKKINEPSKAALGEIIQFIDSMYTESAVDSLGIVFSLAGFLIGILGSDNLK